MVVACDTNSRDHVGKWRGYGIHWTNVIQSDQWSDWLESSGDCVPDNEIQNKQGVGPVDMYGDVRSIGGGWERRVQGKIARCHVVGS